jgi:DnaJ-class molecular chaperone
MTDATKDGLHVVKCPDCNGLGVIREPKYLIEAMTPLGTNYKFITCPMCKGVKAVFVVPARVIGPAVEDGK